MSDPQDWDEVIKDNLSQYGEFGVSTELEDDYATVHLCSPEDLDREEMEEIGEIVRNTLIPGGKYDFSTKDGYYNVRVSSSDIKSQGHL